MKGELRQKGENPLPAFWLALFGAICWGIAPVFGKAGLRGIQPIDGLVARTMITVFFVTTLAFANGSLSRMPSISIRSWLFLSAEAFLATFAGDLAYYAAIKWGAVGQTALILAISPLVTIWIGHFFLGENMNLINFLGAALILVGLVMISLNSSI